MVKSLWLTENCSSQLRAQSVEQLGDGERHAREDGAEVDQVVILKRAVIGARTEHPDRSSIGMDQHDTGTPCSTYQRQRSI